MNYRLSVASLCALLAGSAGAMNLQQAYEAALVNDPVYRTRLHEYEAGRESRVVGRAALLPQLSASYSANRNRADQTQTVGSREITTHPRYISRSAYLQLRQPLFSLDAWARYKQGVAQSNAAEANFESGSDDVAVRTVSAYLDVLFAEDQLALAVAQRNALQEHMRVNARLFEKGEGTRTDVLEVQARLDAAEAQVLESQDNVVAVRETLEGIVGQPVQQLERLAPDFRVPPQAVERSFEEWRSVALQNNPELKAARFNVEATRQEINKARAGHVPRLDFVGNYGDGDSENITQLSQRTVTRAIGIQLTVPIYQGGQVSAATRQAAATTERAQAELDARTSKVLVDLRKAYSQVQNSGAKVDALMKSVASGQLLMKATEQSIKGGVRINLDLLNAQQQLVTSQRDLAQARYAYLLASLRLKAAAGTLEGEDVRQMNAYFR